MRLRITGAGHIGGDIARRAALAGYDVMVSFAWDRAQLAALAEDIDGVVRARGAPGPHRRARFG